MRKTVLLCTALLVTIGAWSQNAGDLILTAVFDGTLSGGVPKGIELYVANDINDLSAFAIGSANNGAGSLGEEYTFPATSAQAGDYLYLTNDSLAFIEFFGFDPDFEDFDNGSVNVNGDDAIELFLNGTVTDVFGEIDVDGTGQAWEYTNGWAYRLDGTGPDGSNFVLDNWFFSGINGLNGSGTNTGANNPLPVGTYSIDIAMTIIAVDDAVTTTLNTPVTFDPLANDIVPGVISTAQIIQSTSNGILDGMDFVQTYTPNMDFCGQDSMVYVICDNNFMVCDTAVVEITVLCASAFPSYDIAEVTATTDGIPDSLGVTCTLTGVVHGIDYQGGDEIQFYLIDATGGVSLFNGVDLGYTVQEGDEVQIEGEITEFNCLTQISPLNISLISSGNDLVDAEVLTNPMTEDQESELVTLESVILLDAGQWDDTGESFNFAVSDGTNTFQIRIDNDTDIAGTASPSQGAELRITGLGGQFDNDGTCDGGYQILPRYQADLTILNSTRDIVAQADLRIVPNPASDEIFLQTQETIEIVRIHSALGTLLLEDTSKQRMLDIKTFIPGIYYVTVQTAASRMIQTLIVQ
ncbi:MAG: T9SS type A sorting domain-containing protein [Bacteroidota bacterium]